MFTRQQAIKEFEELTFRDDFMFCKVLQKNETITKNLIQLITGIRIGGILKLESQEDIRLTWELYSMASSLGLMLIDHVIVGEEGYYSFAENGYCGERRRRIVEALAEQKRP